MKHTCHYSPNKSSHSSVTHCVELTVANFLEGILPIPQSIIDKIDVAVARQLVHPVRYDPRGFTHLIKVGH